MSTVLDKIKQQKNKKFARVSIKIPMELKEKIDFICEINKIESSEYLGAILESSEINKVYTRMKKEEKKRVVSESKSTEEDESSDVKKDENSDNE